jgi:hypothetical protein
MTATRVTLLAVLAAVLALAGCGPRSAAMGGQVEADDDKAAILKLMDEAEACGNRYRCPPLQKLQDRAEQPGEIQVLQVAFDIMADPKVNTFERQFKMASATARAWAAARTTEGHKLSVDDERVLRANVMRLLARVDNVVPGHGFVEYLSDAREIFEREALDPRRGNDEVHSAIRGLRDREPDLTTVKAWLESKDERPMIAGALLLDAFNHDLIQTTDEVGVLIDFAHRGDTVEEAARMVATHAAEHDDVAFAPVLRSFERHSAPSVRELASKALKAVRR